MAAAPAFPIAVAPVAAEVAAAWRRPRWRWRRRRRSGGGTPDQSAGHYRDTGWREGRDPSLLFDTTLYLIHNPDVAAAGVNPLEHFLQFGRAEGRAA